MSRNVVIGIIVILLIVVVIVIIGSGSRSLYTTPKPTTSSTTVKEIKEIIVKGSEFKFDPNTITLKQGEKVKINFKNEGAFPHNFTVTDLGVVSNTINAGQTTSVEFTPNKTGIFTFICTVDSHADRGMKGTIIVK